MTKQTYLNELNTYLKANNVDDIDEIVAEYDEHFTRKMADGYTEEEIAAKLLKPKEIALQFADAGSKTEKKKTNKVLVGIGLFFLGSLRHPVYDPDVRLDGRAGHYLHRHGGVRHRADHPSAPAGEDPDHAADAIRGRRDLGHYD